MRYIGLISMQKCVCIKLMMCTKPKNKINKRYSERKIMITVTNDRMRIPVRQHKMYVCRWMLFVLSLFLHIVYSQTKKEFSVDVCYVCPPFLFR